jgi:hypothetical protein
VNTGPGANRSVPPSKMLEPVTSTGSRSGVPWTRFVSSASARPTARASRVLPVPGTSSTRTWPSARSAVTIRRSGPSAPMTACPTAVRRSSQRRRAGCSPAAVSGSVARRVGPGSVGVASVAGTAADGGSISVSVAGSSGGRGSRQGYAPMARLVQRTPTSPALAHVAPRTRPGPGETDSHRPASHGRRWIGRCPIRCQQKGRNQHDPLVARAHRPSRPTAQRSDRRPSAQDLCRSLGPSLISQATSKPPEPPGASSCQAAAAQFGPAPLAAIRRRTAGRIPPCW